MDIKKYPRTRHLEGSRLQIGDIADDKPLAELTGKALIVEEKVDGANSAVSFNDDGQLMLQSRGHYLTGGGRERHFDMFKTWAAAHAHTLHTVLGARFIMYGEWLFAKHTVFYNRLPHFFMEFDLYDRVSQTFLSTYERRKMLGGLPIMPVPVVHTGELRSVSQIEDLIKPSLYKSTDWRTKLQSAAVDSGSRPDMVEKQTEDSDLAEGLYVKLEQDGVVQDRFKFVRADFHQTIQASDGHWLDRPILPNQLTEGGVPLKQCPMNASSVWFPPSRTGQ